MAPLMSPRPSSRGPSGAIVDVPNVKPPAGRWVLQVDDTTQALQRAADWQRSCFTGRVIAVTGSAGKTTTRQMIDKVLSSRFTGTASPQNYNNHLGVPLSILRWQESDAYAVIEMGASARGEIAELCRLARPALGVITNIGTAHLGSFGGPAAIAQAKGELLEALPSDGLAVLNGDDRQLRRIAERSRAVIEWCGRSGDCDVMATDVRSADGHLQFVVDQQPFSMPVWGRHHLTSALAAIAVGRAFGLSVAEISQALSDFEPPPMRCEVSSFGAARVINDAYNSNPLAMRAALEVLREDPSMGQRIVVCGDMRDLGTEAPRLHRQTGDEVVTVCGADLLVACGEHADDMVAGAIAAGMPSKRTISLSHHGRSRTGARKDRGPRRRGARQRLPSDEHGTPAGPIPAPSAAGRLSCPDRVENVTSFCNHNETLHIVASSIVSALVCGNSALPTLLGRST